MKNIYSFEDYINECYINILREELISLDLILNSNYLTINESKWINSFLQKENLYYCSLNENFLDKIRNSIGRARQKSEDAIRDIGRETLKKLERLAANVNKFVEYIVQKTRELWEGGLKIYNNTIIKEKQSIKNSILKSKESIESNRKTIGNTLREDIKNFKSTLTFWRDDFKNKLISSLKKNLRGILIKESSLIIYISQFDNINESGKFGWVSKIVHTLAKYPPFNILALVRKKATESFGNFLKNISELTNQSGGPGVFKFESLIIIFGALSEVIVKKISLGAASAVIPFTATILSILGYIAYGLLAIEVLEDLIDTGELLGDLVDIK